jgi:hypothetical protein
MNSTANNIHRFPNLMSIGYITKDVFNTIHALLPAVPSDLRHNLFTNPVRFGMVKASKGNGI